jgi:hypothetical protein
MKTVPFGPPPACPTSQPMLLTDPTAPVPTAPAAPDLPPQLASAARMALAIAQGQDEAKREAATDDPDFRKAAAWLRGKSSQRILIEIVMRLSKLEAHNNVTAD